MGLVGQKSDRVFYNIYEFFIISKLIISSVWIIKERMSSNHFIFLWKIK